jgi:PEP-CTERM motif
MNQMLKKSIVGVMLIGLSSGASAATYAFNEAKGIVIPAISETSGNFVLSGYAYSTTATVLDFKNALGQVVLSVNKNNSTNQFALGQTTFLSGNYTLSFNTAALDVKGSFTSALGAVSGQIPVGVSAVPEPETNALMLMGLGLIGFIARRKFA